MEPVKFVIPGRPITKKNSVQLVKAGWKTVPLPSKKYLEYEERAALFLKRLYISGPVNVKCVYYMPDRRRVDLVNLLEATCDILVHYGVLVDDNSKVVVAHDGSRVLMDRARPRVEITIEDVCD